MKNILQIFYHMLLVYSHIILFIILNKLLKYRYMEICNVLRSIIRKVSMNFIKYKNLLDQENFTSNLDKYLI